jgi:hypothetical protein
MGLAAKYTLLSLYFLLRDVLLLAEQSQQPCGIQEISLESSALFEDNTSTTEF